MIGLAKTQKLTKPTEPLCKDIKMDIAKINKK